MSGFTASWLDLREPADHAARSQEVGDFVLRSLDAMRETIILDLGSGTGSNVRYLARLVRSHVRWRLVDDDDALVRAARDRLPGKIEAVVADIREVDRLALDGCALVTASALLDLVAEPWLQALIARCRTQKIAMLFALNFDGRVECMPADPDDEFVRTLVNRHQQTDKGFGPALGPRAGVTAHTLCAEAGYDVRRVTSDWVLGAGHTMLQTELIRGWAGAACDVSPAAGARIAEWARRRLALVDRSSSRIVVGHDDVGAVWPR
jgi:SAM-dependent methyltransferase